MSARPEGYADLADLPEEKRIEIMAHTVIGHGKVVGCIVEDVPAKIARYIAKMKEIAPGVVHLDTTRGSPFPGVATIRFGPQ